MGKVEDMRAIKDARRAALSKAPAPALRTKAAPSAAPVAPAAAPAPEGLCGHRNMGGKACTREADHQKTGTKNHRYS